MVSPSPQEPPEESTDAATSAKTALVVPRKSRLAASVSELLLLFRLRARRAPAPAVSVMQRALNMVLVTCDSWFGRKASKQKAPANPVKRD